MEEQEQEIQRFITGKPLRKRPYFYLPLILAAALMLGFLILRKNTIVINAEDNSWLSTLISSLNLNKKEGAPTPEASRLDILILGIRGSDQRSIEEEGGLLTDTILVVSIDKNSKQAATISIPRDLYIDVLGIKGRINEVYEKGLAKKQGLALAKQAVSKISGVYIDNVLVFDFEAFRGIVDRLGGIEINLAREFKEINQWGYEFFLPAGNNTLDGEQALYYVRSRYSTSDFDRSRRQQEVLTAIKDKALKLGYLANPIKASSLFSELKENVKTDFQIWDFNDLIALANSFNTKSEAKRYVISTDNLVYQSRSARGEFILLPKGNNFDAIKSLFANILN